MSDSLSSSSSLTCRTCGLSFSSRAKWSKRNQVVLYCSQRCRRNKPSRMEQKRQEQLYQILLEASQKIDFEELYKKGGYPDTVEGKRRAKWAIHRLFHLEQIDLWSRNQKIHPDHNRGPFWVSVRR